MPIAGSPGSEFTREIAALLESCERETADHSGDRQLKLVIHAGTPKTGTTSLQTYLDKKQRKLRGKGILYPHNIRGLQNPTAPRHQWFEKNLITTHVDRFLENFRNIIAQVKADTHTIIISSEGIYNYWWDFPEQSHDLLRALGKLFKVEIWVWFRDPLSFIESYYKQCIRNPQLENNPCYGKDLSFADMLDIPWFAKHLDYQGFVKDCQSLFGEHSVSAFEYKGDVVREVIQTLGLATAHDNPTPRQNQSLNNASVALLRTLNRYDLSAKDKESLTTHLKAMNSTLDAYASDSLIDETSAKKVLAMTTTMFKRADRH